MLYFILSHDLNEIDSENEWFYFYYLDEIPSKISKAKYVCELRLCDDSRVESSAEGRKTDRCFIRYPCLVRDFIQEKKLIFSTLSENGTALRFIKKQNQTEDLCLAAVSNNGMALRFVKNKTERICDAAVAQNGLALIFVKDQTEKQCLLAIRQNPEALLLVKDKTLLVCREALDLALALA
jgi:hypothetical protein